MTTVPVSGTLEIDPATLPAGPQGPQGEPGPAGPPGPAGGDGGDEVPPVVQASSSVEWLNVKAFGAKGDGYADDTAAIQAAVDSRSTNHGTIYFPPGLYKLSKPITGNWELSETSAILTGDGVASRLIAYHDGYVLDRNGADIGSGIRVIEKLSIENAHPTGGAIRLRGCVGATVRDCKLGGNKGLHIGFNQSSMVQSCTFSTNGANVDSFAIHGGDNINILNCDISGFDCGISLCARGANVMGCRIECCGTGIGLGKDVINVPPFNIAGWCSILANTFESCGIAIDAWGGVGNIFITNQMVHSFPSFTPYERVVVPTTKITDSVTGATGIGSITREAILTMSDVSGEFGYFNIITGDGVPPGTRIGSAVNADQWWVCGSAAYSLRFLSGAHDMVVSNCSFGGNMYAAAVGILLPDFGRSHNVFISTTASNGGVFPDTPLWKLPAGEGAATCGEFINCDIRPMWTFAQLPFGNDKYQAIEGDRFRIKDGPPDAKWGDVISAGGGSSHYNVEFDGKDWRVA